MIEKIQSKGIIQDARRDIEEISAKLDEIERQKLRNREQGLNELYEEISNLRTDVGRLDYRKELLMIGGGIDGLSEKLDRLSDHLLPKAEENGERITTKTTEKFKMPASRYLIGAGIAILIIAHVMHWI